MEDNEGSEGTALAVKGVLAGGGAILVLMNPTAALLPVVTAIMPDVGEFLTKKILGTQQRRLKKFFSRFTKDESTFDIVEARLHAELLTDPHLSQTAWAAVRAILDVLDDSVVPTLGALAAEYREQKKPADSFFRGVTGILTGLAAAEFAALKVLVAAFARFEKDDDPLHVHANADTGKLEIARSKGWDDVGMVSPHNETLFRLLKAHALADEAGSGMFGQQSGPEFLCIRRDTVLRLMRILVD